MVSRDVFIFNLSIAKLVNGMNGKLAKFASRSLGEMIPSN